MLKKRLKKNYLNEFKTLSNLKMRREVVEILLKKINLKYLPKMFDQEKNFLKSQSKGQTDKEIKDYTNRRVRLGIIISSISEDNKISIRGFRPHQGSY